MPWSASSNSYNDMIVCTVCKQRVFCSNIIMHVDEVDWSTGRLKPHENVCVWCASRIRANNEFYEKIANYFRVHPGRLRLLRDEYERNKKGA